MNQWRVSISRAGRAATTDAYEMFSSWNSHGNYLIRLVILPVGAFCRIMRHYCAFTCVHGRICRRMCDRSAHELLSWFYFHALKSSGQIGH